MTACGMRQASASSGRHSNALRLCVCVSFPLGYRAATQMRCVCVSVRLSLLGIGEPLEFARRVSNWGCEVLLPPSTPRAAPAGFTRPRGP